LLVLQIVLIFSEFAVFRRNAYSILRRNMMRWSWTGARRTQWQIIRPQFLCRAMCC